MCTMIADPGVPAPTTDTLDIALESHGGLVLLQPLSGAADAHLRAMVGPEATWWSGALVLEPRYVEPFLAALADDGFRVPLPGAA